MYIVKLRETRIRLKLSIRDLHYITNIDKGTLSQFEREVRVMNVQHIDQIYTCLKAYIKQYSLGFKLSPSDIVSFLE